MPAALPIAPASNPNRDPPLPNKLPKVPDIKSDSQLNPVPCAKPDIKVFGSGVFTVSRLSSMPFFLARSSDWRLSFRMVS